MQRSVAEPICGGAQDASHKFLKVGVKFASEDAMSFSGAGIQGNEVVFVHKSRIFPGDPLDRPLLSNNYIDKLLRKLAFFSVVMYKAQKWLW